MRPLILGVKRRGLGPIADLPRRDPHRQADGLIRSEEQVRQIRGVGEVLDLLGEVRALVAELHAVRAGDVRRGRPPDLGRLVVVEVIVEPPEHHERRELRDLREIGERPGRRHPAPLARVARDPRFEQQLARDRRAPRPLPDVLRLRVIRRERLGRLKGAERAGGEPVRAGSSAGAGARRQIRRLTALRLVVLVEAELVPRRRLPRHPAGVDGLAARVAVRDRGVRGVRPRIRIAGVGVGVRAGNVLRLTEVTDAAVEPQRIFLDRAAHRSARVVVVVNRGGILNPVALERRIEVAALRPRSGGAPEQLALELVAARLRDDVEVDPAFFRFAEPARQVHLDFLRVGRVEDVAGDSSTVERRADVEAVERHVALVAAAAVAGEDAHGGRERDVEIAAGHRRHGCEDRIVTAGDRERPDDICVQDLLTRRALHVDDRGLAGDRDRLSDGSHLQVRVDRDDSGATHFDARAPHRAESGERERDRVGAWRQLGQLVLAGRIGDGRARLLDQRGAGCLDGGTREHTAGCVLDNARQRRLSESRGGQHRQRRQGQDDPSQRSHKHSSCGRDMLDCGPHERA